MRVHVALMPSEFPRSGLAEQAVMVVDVMRASTTVVAACQARCRQVIPVADAEAARHCAREFATGEALLAGERGGEAVPGFDLGNSPLEYTPERVGGRTVILTTTNGTAAMIAAAPAAVAGVAALTNLAAAARWALGQGRNLTILCAGEKGGFSLEDAACAGLLVDRLLTAAAGVDASDAGVAARRIGQHYASDLRRLAEDSTWARKLLRTGRSADVEACLALGTADAVPVLARGVIRPNGASPAARLGSRAAAEPSP